VRPRGGWALRALAAGAAAGTVGGVVLCALLARRGVALDDAAPLLLVAAAAGGGFGLLLRQRDPGETLFLGVAYGALGWCLGPLTLQPLAAGQLPAWSVVAAQRQFASLLGYLLYGASTGLAYALLPARRSSARGARRGRLAGALLRGALAGTIVALVLQVRGGLAVGPLLGLAQALEAPRPSRGFGAALLRGQGFGFLAWVAVLGGASRWSVEQARSSFPALLAYLLLGVAIALLRRCLDGLAALLSPERLRVYAGAAATVAGGRPRAALHGAVAGLVGAAALAPHAAGAGAGLLGAVSPAPHGVGVGAEIPSLLALCGAGAALGVLYGLLFRRLDQDLSTALGWGLSYGFLWWALGPLTLVPALAGQDLQWSAAEAAGAFGRLVALLLHGACLGVAFHLLQAPYRAPWAAAHGAAASPEQHESQPVAASAALLLTILLMVLVVLADA
jgi:hypothetical protein